jgi:hypothetical protein
VLADARHYLSALFPDHLPKLDALLAAAMLEVVDDPTREEVSAHRDLVRDIEDVPVVLAAAKAEVDYLVSTDTDLTDLDPSTEALRQLLDPGRAVGSGLSSTRSWVGVTRTSVLSAAADGTTSTARPGRDERCLLHTAAVVLPKWYRDCFAGSRSLRRAVD